MINRAYISFGSNLGNRLEFLKEAIRGLQKYDLRIENISSVYETYPQYLTEQPKYLNCVAFISTKNFPMQLLEICKTVENLIGKNKKIPYGPRNIDIDILTFNDFNISEPELKIPHPLMCDRNFVLTPLKEISPNFIINGTHIDDLLIKCKDQNLTLFLPSIEFRLMSISADEINFR